MGPHDPFVLQEPVLAEALKSIEYMKRAGFPTDERGLQELLQCRARVLNEARAKPVPRAMQSTEKVSAMRFNNTGTLLACANTGGLRIYDWDELISSTVQTPPPRFAVEAEETPTEVFEKVPLSHGYTYDVCFDDFAERVLFCGMEGKVKSLDLASGAVQTLLQPLDRGPLLRLSLSSDHSALAIGYKPVFFERAPKTKWLWQVWNYRDLGKSEANESAV